jgi:putative restriction endonuclease
MRRNWTKDELVLALNLYLKLPFGKMHAGNPDIIKLAGIIGRTPDAVAMRLSNYAAVDPYHQQRGIGGLPGGRKQVEPIWNEYVSDREDFLFESEKLLAQYTHTSIESLNDIPEEELPKEGKMREQVVKVRVNQSFFRKTILAAYNDQCCITGINQRELLVAGHIMPWKSDEANRLNPRNGVAINALHDKAFECGLLTITPDYTILISSTLLKAKSDADFFTKYHEQKMILPTRYLPDRDFLKYHYEHRFRS